MMNDSNPLLNAWVPPPTATDTDEFGMGPFTPTGQHTLPVTANSTHCAPAPVIQYVMPAVTPTVTFSDKIIKKFSGYMHEDANKFLTEFRSYLVLSNINPDTDPGRAVAAFHLHLQGPARTWFNNISDRSSWDTVESHFQTEYCDLTKVCNDSRYISESAAFENLRLGPSQPIEEFHSVIFEKGNILLFMLFLYQYYYFEIL